jgi:2-polyprenyl-6-methoxyphenol hydroxylase-like FAD-dependent oxidoreductase
VRRSNNRKGGPVVTLTELQALLDDAGLAAKITHLAWSAQFPLQHRLAGHFPSGPSVSGGDAAHTWSPATGQGMNTGTQNALNLGWKLAFARSATNLTALINSYELERGPVARRVQALTHLAFWAEAGSALLPSLMRAVLGPLGAPAVTAVLGRRELVAAMIRWISQLRVS